MKKNITSIAVVWALFFIIMNQSLSAESIQKIDGNLRGKLYYLELKKDYSSILEDIRKLAPNLSTSDRQYLGDLLSRLSREGYHCNKNLILSLIEKKAVLPQNFTALLNDKIVLCPDVVEYTYLTSSSENRRELIATKTLHMVVAAFNNARQEMGSVQNQSPEEYGAQFALAAEKISRIAFVLNSFDKTTKYECIENKNEGFCKINTLYKQYKSELKEYSDKILGASKSVSKSGGEKRKEEKKESLIKEFVGAIFGVMLNDSNAKIINEKNFVYLTK